MADTLNDAKQGLWFSEAKMGAGTLFEQFADNPTRSHRGNSFMHLASMRFSFVLHASFDFSCANLLVSSILRLTKVRSIPWEISRWMLLKAEFTRS